MELKSSILAFVIAGILVGIGGLVLSELRVTNGVATFVGNESRSYVNDTTTSLTNTDVI